MKINNFRGDLSSISAKTATLAITNGFCAPNAFVVSKYTCTLCIREHRHVDSLALHLRERTGELCRVRRYYRSSSFCTSSTSRSGTWGCRKSWVWWSGHHFSRTPSGSRLLSYSSTVSWKSWKRAGPRPSGPWWRRSGTAPPRRRRIKPSFFRTSSRSTCCSASCHGRRCCNVTVLTTSCR